MGEAQSSHWSRSNKDRWSCINVKSVCLWLDKNSWTISHISGIIWVIRVTKSCMVTNSDDFWLIIDGQGHRSKIKVTHKKKLYFKGLTCTQRIRHVIKRSKVTGVKLKGQKCQGQIKVPNKSRWALFIVKLLPHFISFLNLALEIHNFFLFFLHYIGGLDATPSTGIPNVSSNESFQSASAEVYQSSSQSMNQKTAAKSSNGFHTIASDSSIKVLPDSAKDDTQLSMYRSVHMASTR